jgi:hypothetical protein
VIKKAKEKCQVSESSKVRKRGKQLERNTPTTRYQPSYKFQLKQANLRLHGQELAQRTLLSALISTFSRDK